MKRKKPIALLAAFLLLAASSQALALVNAAGQLEIFWERDGVLEAGEQPPDDISYTVLRTLELGQADTSLPWSGAWTRDYQMQEIAYDSPRTGRDATGWIVTKLAEHPLDAQPALTAEYDALLTVPSQVSGASLCFAACNKALGNDNFSKAGAADMALADALRRTLDAIMEKYGETEGTLLRFQLSYGFRNQSAYFQAPYWQFDLRHPVNPLDSYEVMVHSSDGAILYIAGPGEGNG